jgi:hypothetical protein
MRLRTDLLLAFPPLYGEGNNDHVRSPLTFKNPHCKEFFRDFSVPEVFHTFLTRFGIHRNAHNALHSDLTYVGLGKEESRTKA